MDVLGSVFFLSLGLLIGMAIKHDQIQRMAGGLVQYGYHEPGCDTFWTTNPDCDCGFDEAYKDALRVLK